jgi:hypothetical protein
MSVTFYASGEAEAAESPRLNLSNNQARDFFRWLGLPVNDLCGSMWAEDLAERVRRVLHPAVVAVSGQWPAVLSLPAALLPGGGMRCAMTSQRLRCRWRRSRSMQRCIVYPPGVGSRDTRTIRRGCTPLSSPGGSRTRLPVRGRCPLPAPKSAAPLSPGWVLRGVVRGMRRGLACEKTRLFLAQEACI